jgi:hypothetical protein
LKVRYGSPYVLEKLRTLLNDLGVRGRPVSGNPSPAPPAEVWLCAGDRMYMPEGNGGVGVYDITPPLQPSLQRRHAAVGNLPPRGARDYPYPDGVPDISAGWVELSVFDGAAYGTDTARIVVVP